MAKKADETNPFVQSLRIPAIWKLQTGKEEHHEESLSISLNARVIDTDIRCQIFPGNMLHWFKGLPTSAKDMVIWISLRIGFSTDVVEIREERYCEDLGISRATFYAAKAALTNHLIIPRTSRRNTYWVNPAYLFKGDRTKVYRSNLVMGNSNPLDKLNE